MRSMGCSWMWLISTTLLAVLLQTAVVSGGKKNGVHIPMPYTSFGLFGHRKEMVRAEPSEYERYFDQKTDQLNYPGKYHYQNYVPTFKQRYFINTQWKNKQNGNVNILWVEGEGTADDSTVTDVTLPHVALGKQLGANLYTLEHRFRGKSQPFRRTFHNNYYDYLSSAQAIEDIVNFINSTNNATKEDNPKWVVFGRNYGAVLALWFRLKYPTYSVGVVADSPAVVPTVNFYNYQKFIEEAYSNYSYDCWHGTKFSALAIRNELQYGEGTQWLNEELKITPQISWRMDYKDYQHLHHNIIELFEIPILYSKVNIGPFSTSCGTEDFCKYMSNREGRDIQRVYDWAKHLYTNTHKGKDDWPGVNNIYNDMIEYINNTRHDPEDTEQPSARSWLFQRCHEFGQFITTDSGNGLFSSTVPNDYWIGICTDSFEEKIFTYTVDNLKDGIRKLKSTFDTSQEYKGTNAVIFYGALDPWTLLGVTSVKDSSSTVYNVPGLGHAPVLMPRSSTDSKQLKDARSKYMVPSVKKWITASKRNLAAKAKKMFKPSTETDADTTTVLPPIEFKEPKRSVSGIGYFANQSEHVIWDMKIPSVEETIRERHFPFVGSINHQIHNHLRKKMKDVHERGRVQTSKKKDLRAGYVDQFTDHFDDSSDMMFKQRFFKNDVFQEDKDAVRFLMIGGESAINAFYVEDDFLHYYRWAKDFRAVMYALEHRFYGYSQPFGNSSTYLLVKYLTTEQVLADIYVFINTMNSVENNTNPRWILFGGSYAGNLVAIFRLRFPQLTLGGIASSAPLKAKVDFYEYLQKVDKDIHKYGSRWCASYSRRFFAYLRKYMNLRWGRMRIKERFCLSNRWDENYIDEKDAAYFPMTFLFYLEHLTQDDSENHSNLRSFCYMLPWVPFTQHRNRKLSRRTKRSIDKFLSAIGPSKMYLNENMRAQNDNPITDYYMYEDEDSDNYHDYDDSQATMDSDANSGAVEEVCPSQCFRCKRVSYNQYLDSLEDVNRHCPSNSYCTDESRIWLWLQCSQWGYIQSTNYGYNIFESVLPINFYLGVCSDVFGQEYNRTMIDAAVARTNAAYGGQDNYNGTNVMFINGSEDPWSTLSVYKPLQPKANVTSILVPGVSHCADMNREDVHDAHELKDARKQIKKQIVRWVHRPRGPLVGNSNDN